MTATGESLFSMSDSSVAGVSGFPVAIRGKAGLYTRPEALSIIKEPLEIASEIQKNEKGNHTTEKQGATSQNKRGSLADHVLIFRAHYTGVRLC